MANKIILNLAVSLDGFIADEYGGFDWIKGSGNINTKEKWTHSNFLETVSSVIMGKKCFDQDLHLEYKNKQVYVATSKEIKDHNNIHFIRGNVLEKALELKEEGNGNIYLFGGGILTDAFLKAKAVDEYIIGIIPVILGKGIPLFLKDNPFIPLELTHYYIDNGIVILRYLPAETK